MTWLPGRGSAWGDGTCAGRNTKAQTMQSIAAALMGDILAPLRGGLGATCSIVAGRSGSTRVFIHVRMCVGLAWLRSYFVRTPTERGCGLRPLGASGACCAIPTR